MMLRAVAHAVFMAEISEIKLIIRKDPHLWIFILQELTCPRCSSEFVESLSDITQSALFDDVAYSDALNNLEQSRHIVDRVEDSLDDLTQTSTVCHFNLLTFTFLRHF